MKENKPESIRQKVIAILIVMILAFSIGGTVTPALAQHEGHGGTQKSPEQSVTQKPPEQSKEQPAVQKDEQAAEEEEAPTVEITPEKQQLIGVRTVKVAYASLRRTIRTVGRIEYDERKFATLNAKFEGWIEKLYVDTTGQRVAKGDPLAEIYSPELLATQQEFLNLLKYARPGDGAGNGVVGGMLARDAESITGAARERLRLWDISDAQIEEIERTGKPLRTLLLTSPVDGYVVQKTALQGMRVMPGEKLFDVADLSTVWIIADIYEYELPFIREGDMARIGLSYLPGKEFAARIEYVYPALAEETRTAKVRFSIPNPGGRLKPQMFTNVELKVGMGRRLAIPEDAVIDTGERRIVYVDKGEGLFEPREITVGLRADGMVEVLKGLKPNERVASAANFLIDSEAKLKGIVK